MHLNTITTTLLALAPFALAKGERGMLCGPKLAKCPVDMCCVPDPCIASVASCSGHCDFKNQYPSCGGFRVEPLPCAKGSTCRDDPRTPESCGMACDAPGICVPDKAPPCGGIAGFQCPEGLFCYDDPKDGCDVTTGGRDCIGICL